ncbi:hypothetical protein C0992_006899 [Termitomyces sp. T32_za158]|nr:hypothetical protein C0992_006899 [Termitomyces sp. T32_za158]
MIASAFFRIRQSRPSRKQHRLTTFARPQSRMKWVQSLGHELGGQAKADALIKGQGVSLILKSIEVRFRRPVTFPDTLLIGYRPRDRVGDDPAVLNVTASAYSIAQQATVATSREALVWYDYDRLRKCVPNEDMQAVISGRMAMAMARGSS